ncbi:MAG TPA: erythromycin esterase family protein [Longimicrobiaceae bacterium]|nr:erythromycin esterase family protein [Longimicrobiaceae bacterium]
MFPRIATALLLLALAAPGCASDTAGVGRAGSGYALRDLDWLRASAVLFRTTDPGGDAADLAPLRGMVGGARMVGLGEATHGTSEFFRMKHRVLEHLVEEMGFTVFAIEASWAESERINDYVRGGPGDPRELLSATKFWTWRAQEVVDMIEWMRRHNRAPGDAPRVEFRGFDMQYSRVAMDDVEAFVSRVDPARLAEVRGRYACFRRYEEDALANRRASYAAAGLAEQQACREGVQAVHGLLEGAREGYTAASSAAEYERALRAARIVVQNEDVLLGGNVPRDRYMAENAAWLLDQAGPGARMVLWAHNAHVSAGVGAMGSHLRERFGADYLAVALSFEDGTFNAVEQGWQGNYLGVKTMHAPPPIFNTYEYQFRRLGLPRFLLDLRPLRARTDEATAWLRGPLGLRSIGAVYRPATPQDFYTRIRLPEEFDLLVHVAESSPSELIVDDTR